MKSFCVVKENGKTNLAIVDKPFKRMNAHDAKIKVLYGGICGTDVKLIEGKYPISDKKLPLTIGHEFVGEIVELGKASNSFKVGDYVVGKPTLKSCMECEYCKSGKINLCNKRLRLGINADGAFTEYISLPEKNLINVNFLKEVSNGIWVEPLSVVARGLNTLKINPNQKIMIAGVGPIGVLTALLFQEFNCDITMIGLESDQETLNYLKKIGIIDHFTVNIERKNLFNCVVDCTGNESAVNNLLLAAKPMAQVLLLGTSKYLMNIDLSLTTYKELHLTGTIGANEEDWDYAVKFIKRNQLILSDFVNVFPFDDALENFKIKKSLKVKNVIKFA